MKKEILFQIQRLGVNIDYVKGNSLQEQLELIKFKHPLYPNDYGDKLYGIDKSYEKNQQLYLDSKQDFYNNLFDHFFL